MKRVVLLNPPSRDVAIRDYFCSKISQAGYINPPVDFVCLSGRLAEHFDVRLIDAVAQRLSPTRCASEIRELMPDAIIALTGFVSWREDVEFFESLGGIPLILIGDILLEGAEQRLRETTCADAFLLDFTGDGSVRYLLGERGGLSGMVYRDGERGIVSEPVDHKTREFSLPVPKHELFIKLDYRYPFVAGRPFASVLTEYGCTYKCGFCIMGQLGHKVRPVENVMEEMRALRGLGVKDVFFMDQTFASDGERARAMLEALAGFTPRFRWLCFSRVDRADAELLPLMKRAGCHTIIYGIESAENEVLKSYNKGYSWEQIEKTFSAAKKAGIRTVGTLLFGLPGDTVRNCERTIDAVKKLPCDFISINIAAPRMGTPMRRDAVKKGFIDEGLDRMDQSGTFIAMPQGEFSAGELMRLKRRAIREFYFNLQYIQRRMSGMRTMSQFRIEARQGLALIVNFIRNR